AQIASLVGITTKQLKKFNPGVKCSGIKKGRRLCVTAGELPKKSSGTAMVTT
ncbi:hypothetical protein H0H87_010303, partial [Tephrocybe sp. NHM501043]